MRIDLKDIKIKTNEAFLDLLSASDFKPKDIVVLGGSTSEVIGENIGSSTNLEVATAILEGILPETTKQQLFLAIQCCEHLNRALVVEEECAQKYGWEIVSVLPWENAGGGLATVAMKCFETPVVVEALKADAGMDIGDTFIGMHIKPVGVPVRSKIKSIGNAHLTMIRHRPKLIGGERARYKKDTGSKKGF